jgi:N-acetylneuraminic acid mutarotase
MCLETRNWISVVLTGPEELMPRASGVSCYHENRLYIFGGVNAEGYTTTELEMIDFDQSKVQKWTYVF